MARSLRILAVRFAALTLIWLGLAAGASAQEIALELNKGDLVRLPEPAAAVFIANPAIADIQVMAPSLVYVFGLGVGETSLFAIGENDEVLVDRPIVVTHNLDSLQGEIEALLPEAAISARSVQGGILLTGQVASAADAEDARRLAAQFIGEGADIINRLTVNAPSQIQLRVRVAEVSRTVSKQFGVNWEALGTVGNFTFGLAQGADINIVDGVVSRVGQGSNLFAGFNSGSLDVNGLIDALEEEGLVTVLAEPNLTAMSGETASFLAGGEFPIPLVEDESLTVEYKEFGVSLAFTPTLVGDGRINLRVRPEVSQLSSAGAVVIEGLEIPALTTRRAETTVELGSGQSFAIAGLLQNNSNQSIARFPFLGDLPVLGALFRSTSFQRDESELVIIVTPYLVRPVSTDRLAIPQQDLLPPNDADRLLNGRFVGHAAASAGGEGAPVSLVGPVGFILE